MKRLQKEEGETIKIVEPVNEEILLPCNNCIRKTYHKVLVSVDITGFAGYGEFHYEGSYQVIRCQGCRSESFREYVQSSEDLEPWEKLYPKRVRRITGLRGPYRIPYRIKEIYKETLSALENEMPILAGVGIRALVEAVCNEKKAEGNLEKKIDNLVTLGILTKDGAETLHSLRLMGNKAAHEVEPHDMELLNIAMDVVEHLLNGVYIIPKAAKRLTVDKN